MSSTTVLSFVQYLFFLVRNLLEGKHLHNFPEAKQVASTPQLKILWIFGLRMFWMSLTQFCFVGHHALAFCSSVNNTAFVSSNSSKKNNYCTPSMLCFLSKNAWYVSSRSESSFRLESTLEVFLEDEKEGKSSVLVPRLGRFSSRWNLSTLRSSKHKNEEMGGMSLKPISTVSNIRRSLRVIGDLKRHARKLIKRKSGPSNIKQYSGK